MTKRKLKRVVDDFTIRLCDLTSRVKDLEDKGKGFVRPKRNHYVTEDLIGEGSLSEEEIQSILAYWEEREKK